MDNTENLTDSIKKLMDGLTKYDETVIIPKEYSIIQEPVYKCNTTIKQIVLPEEIEKIESIAFSGCMNLLRISVDTNNLKYRSENGVLFDKDMRTLIYYPCGKKDISYKIPDGVTTIAKRAFSGCDALTNITLPDSLLKIEDEAFEGCLSLEKIELPANITSIGSQTFYNCSCLTSINVNTNNLKYSSAEGVLFDKDMRTLIYYPCGKKDVSYKIPDNLVEIEDCAFYRCDRIMSVNIPESVEKMGRLNPFRYCNNLININVNENNLKYCSVNGVLFNKTMYSLLCYPSGKKDKLYEVPNNVSIIELGAIDNENLKIITIPNNVTEFALSPCWNGVIRCCKHSYAHLYAIENKIKYKLACLEAEEKKTESTKIFTEDMTVEEMLDTLFKDTE